MDAIGIADRNTLAGVVRMHSAAKGAGLRPLIGCRLDLADAPSLLAYPIDRDGYGRLSRLLSLGKMRVRTRANAICRWPRSRTMREGIAFIAWPGEDLDAFASDLPAAARRPSVAAPCRRGASLSRRRPGADRAARPASREGARLHHPRHQRRPLSCARQAAAAGRDDLHPREGDDRRSGLSAATPMPSGI